jgi:GDP-L-fucose synthase
MAEKSATGLRYGLTGKRIFVAGHRGMVGSALVRELQDHAPGQIITASRSECDLRVQSQVAAFLKSRAPDLVFICAAKVGGIRANEIYPADFIYDNLMIEANLIHQSYLAGVKKLVNLGSSCIYPKHAPQPIEEASLLTGPLEPTNQWYAVAKIAGIKLCQAYNAQYGTQYVSVQPTNLYGPGDNYDLETSHVLPALLRKLIVAKRENAPTVEIWGTGSPLREFLHVKDLASALVTVAQQPFADDLINIGSGSEISIRQLAELIVDIVGYDGNLVFDTSKPDGTPRKLMDSSRMRQLGWAPCFDLKAGIEQTLSALKEARSNYPWL